MSRHVSDRHNETSLSQYLPEHHEGPQRGEHSAGLVEVASVRHTQTSHIGGFRAWFREIVVGQAGFAEPCLSARPSGAEGLTERQPAKSFRSEDHQRHRHATGCRRHISAAFMIHASQNDGEHWKSTREPRPLVSNAVGGSASRGDGDPGDEL